MVRVPSTTRDGVLLAKGDPRVHPPQHQHSRPYWKMRVLLAKGDPRVHPTPHPHSRPYWKMRVFALAGVVLGAIFAVFVLGTGLLMGEVPAIRAANQREADLIHGLMSHGVTHVYTDYWSCDSMAFLSNEQIICGVIDGNLQFSHNRVPRYIALVSGDTRAAYVLPMGSSQLSLFERKVAKAPGRYRHYILSGYVVYQPV